MEIGMVGGPQWLLIGAVAAVGVLHTVVPDHWVPITLIARQQGWTKREVARAALVAGTGHTVSTLVIGLVVWIAGVAFAARFGNAVSTVSSLALIAFGGWIALTSLRELQGHGHGHSHGPGHNHGPYERDHDHKHEDEDEDEHEHEHEGGHEHRGGHERVHRPGHKHERGHEHRANAKEIDDALFVPSAAGTTVLVKHVHLHRHGRANVHAHLHDHGSDTWHEERAGLASDPPSHDHKHRRSFRTTLLLILGSSPMVEGIPAFFAAGKYGAGLIAVMALVFAASTIATYIALCVTSVASLQRMSLGPLERYGEVLSGAFIALVGAVFLVYPVL